MLLLVFIVLYALIIIIIGSHSFPKQNVDYLIVLGKALKQNQMEQELVFRCDKAIQYLKENLNTKVIVSGGITKNNQISEASLMKEYLMQKGIEEERIILENQAKDTIGNIYYSLFFLKNTKDIMVVSSDYHLLRVKMIAAIAGCHCDCITIKTPFNKLLLPLLLEEVFIIDNYFKAKKIFKNRRVNDRIEIYKE